MQPFKLGVWALPSRSNFQARPRFARGRQRPRCLLASSQHRQRYLAGRGEESRLKLDAAAVLFPASHDASC
jgi:hypothetical protein